MEKVLKVASVVNLILKLRTDTETHHDTNYIMQPNKQFEMVPCCRNN